MQKKLKLFLKLIVIAGFLAFGALSLLKNSEQSLYPPLEPAEDGRPLAAAHYMADYEDGKIKLALQVLAPGGTIEALRIDNITGQSSLWRSDGTDENAIPLIVTRQGVTVADGSGKMNIGPLGKAEDILELTVVDNGAFKERQSDFRVTVFLAGGARANCLLQMIGQPVVVAKSEVQTVNAQGGQPEDAKPDTSQEAKSEESSPEEDRSFVDKLKEQFFSAEKIQTEEEPAPIAETQPDNDQDSNWWSRILSWANFSDRNSPYMPYNGWWNACRQGKKQIIGQNHSGTETYEGCVISRVVYYPEEGFMYEKANEIALAIARAAASTLERKREYSEDDKDIIVEISGYLNVTEAGTHVLSVIRKNITDKSVIDDTVICIDNEDCTDSKDSVFSTKAELNPGLHTITFGIELPFEDFESEPNPLHYIDITLQRPSDAKELPISDFLLGKKMSAEEMKEMEEKMEQLKEAQDAADDEKFSDKVKDHISDIIANTIKKVL